MIQCKADGYGVHYGAWRAAQGGVFLMKEDTIPAGWKKCEYCGEVYKPSRSDQKFCGAYCQSQAAYERSKNKNK
jgi:hypothetical protein